MLKKGNDTVPLGLSHIVEHLEANGCTDHVYIPTEQIIFGAPTFFRDEYGTVYGDVYMAYSTSELALEYQNGTPWVRGKYAIRYLRINL